MISNVFFDGLDLFSSSKQRRFIDKVVLKNEKKIRFNYNFEADLYLLSSIN